ncbi:MAG: hypothetical protein ACI9FN_000980 [Saprospiraceae bacterium]|jgi:hypothetical protein
MKTYSIEYEHIPKVEDTAAIYTSFAFPALNLDFHNDKGDYLH